MGPVAMDYKALFPAWLWVYFGAFGSVAAILYTLTSHLEHCSGVTQLLLAFCAELLVFLEDVFTTQDPGNFCYQLTARHALLDCELVCVDLVCDQLSAG